MSKNKGIIGLGLIVAIVLGVAVVGGGAYYLGKSNSGPKVINPENILPNVDNQKLPVVEDKKVEVKASTNSQIVSECNSISKPSIKVLSPNGGEVYKAGDKITVKWVSCNVSTNKELVASFYYLRPGSNAGNVSASVSLNDGIEILTIPENSEILGKFYKVTVEESAGPDTKEYLGDSSDNTFTINSASETYTYKNHGFTIKLPKGYIPKEEQAEGGPAIMIKFPNNSGLNYITNATFWNDLIVREYKYIKDEKVGETTFKVYSFGNATLYYFKQGNVAYEFYGDKEILKTFKFVGWN